MTLDCLPQISCLTLRVIESILLIKSELCSHNLALYMLTKSSNNAFTNSAHRKTTYACLGDCHMPAFLVSLWKDERGATAIEYGLIAALIAVAAVTVMGTVGTNLSTTFNTVATKL